jgi:hypothetical protein
MSFQRFYRRALERTIIRPVLETEYSPEQVKELAIRMRWGPVSRLELTVDQAISSLQANGIGRNEFRLFLSQHTGFELLKDPEYMGIQGGATITEEGETVGSATHGYDKGPKGSEPDEGEEEGKGVKE